MLFVSKVRELRLIRKPSDRLMDELRRPIVVRGERVEFENHKFKTEDPDLVEWLLDHPLYGTEFTSDKKDDRPVQKQPIIDKIVLADTDDVNPIRPREEKKSPPVPVMVQGSLATVKTVEVPKPASKPEQKSESITKEDIVVLVRDEVTSAIKELVTAMKNIQASAPVKPKRTFPCHECGVEFASGIQLGRHKKEHHGVK